MMSSTTADDVVETGLRILHDNAGAECAALLQLGAGLNDAAMSPADRARLLLDTNISPGFQLDHASLSSRDAFALRNALITAAELSNPT